MCATVTLPLLIQRHAIADANAKIAEDHAYCLLTLASHQQKLQNCPAFTISCTDTAKSAKHFVFEPPFSWNKEKGSSVKALYWRRGIVLMHSTPPKGLIVRAIDTNEFIGFLKCHSLMQRYLQVPCTLRLIIFNHQNALAVLLFIKLEFRE